MSTWVLLRGLVRESRHWGNFPELLARELPEAQVLPLDLPGNGSLNKALSPLTIPAMAEYCRTELARQGVPPPYHLLAMSMGGMVAAAWATAHPQEVNSCVLINTSFGSFSPLHQRLRPGALLRLIKGLLTLSDHSREGVIFSLTSNLPREHAPQVVEAWCAIRSASPVSPGNTARQLLASARYKAPLKAPVPTLLLLGAGDRLVDPQCSREIAARWDCALAVHPWAGHDLTLDDGPWVAGRVRNWLQQD